MFEEFFGYRRTDSVTDMLFTLKLPSEMTYIVSSGALNSTHSLPPSFDTILHIW